MTTALGACSCDPPHSRRVHRNGHGRCKVIGCSCLFGPAPVVRTPRPRSTKPPSERSKLESLLWHRIELAGLPMPLKQFYWARSEKRMYRSDFAYAEERILIEVQGGIWAADPGRHNRASGFEQDARRANLAVLLGFRLLVFTERMVRDGTAVDSIQRALIPAPEATNQMRLPDKICPSNAQAPAPRQTAWSVASRELTP